MSDWAAGTLTPAGSDNSAGLDLIGLLPAASALADELVAAWSSWGPTLSPDARSLAFISDRRGLPELWVSGPEGRPEALAISSDPVLSVAWSADGGWLSVAVATDGGVRQQVWVVRPDGAGLRRVAGSDRRHAVLGPWTRSGHRLIVSLPAVAGEQATECLMIEPATGDAIPLAAGELLTVLDLSDDERFVLMRDGTRGAQFCVVVDRAADRNEPLLPFPHTGSTDVGLLRRTPPGDPLPLVAYLVTDAGLPRRVLVAQPIGEDGSRGHTGVLAERDDAELELLDADEAGRLLVLVWNVAGANEIELLDTWTGRRRSVTGLPAPVVSGCLLSRNGSRLVLCLEGPDRPRQLYSLDLDALVDDAPDDAPDDAAEPVAAPDDRAGVWQVATPVPADRRSADGVGLAQLTGPPADRWADRLISPTLERFTAHDGLPLTGWLYRPPGQAERPGPVVIHLHGGPEAQEQPTFSPQHQVLAAAGITVFAPNVRGSSGFGRAFVHADDRYGRFDGIADVRSCVEYLVGAGIADPDRVAVSGRSYGGYLTLAALVSYPSAFAAGVDICGMSDLRTFYRDTEPWIAAAAVSKYGDPGTDADLLAALSPLARADRITAPLLVVHGELDTNVPIGEARQIVAALQRRGQPVDYLQLAGEGHEYRRADSRRALIGRMLEFLVGRLTQGRPATDSR